jgi:phosphoglycerol transferase
VLCALIASASGSFYYAGFTVVLLAAATLIRFAFTLDLATLATGCATSVAIVAISTAHATPTLLYWHEHGRVPDVAERQPFESEYYSLRLTQLILPAINHRLEPFARARETYGRWGPSTGIPTTEAVDASLGTLGSLGLVGLIAATLASAIEAKARRRIPPLLPAAGAAAVLAFLVATMGGFSSLIGLLYPGLRAWNRLSIFIAFFALLAVGVALDRTYRRLASVRFGRPLFAAVLGMTLVLGVLDQTSPAYAPGYEETQARYRSDREFVRMIERRLSPGAAIFQLPYASFPEYTPPPPGRTVVYDLLRPYIHSNALRWSFGAVHGRPADWAGQLADKPLREVVPVASAVGFDALYVDRLGYATDASADAAVEELVRLVGRQPEANDDGRLLFFDLRAYNARLKQTLPPAELARLRRVVPVEPG